MENYSTNATISYRIRLDVGGKIFSVSRQTLSSIPGTYFYALVSFPEKYRPLEDGTYFIDRNPEVFDRVLDYLRNGKLVFECLNDYQKQLLK